MCLCLAKCLVGAMFGWLTFGINIVAAGALLAGAFGPYAVYSAGVIAFKFTAVISGLGAAGVFTGLPYPVPAIVSLGSISTALVDLNKLDSSIAWTETNLNAIYLGVAAQAAAAAIILFFALLKCCTCLCRICCCCCPGAGKLESVIAIAKFVVALIGVSFLPAHSLRSALF